MIVFFTPADPLNAAVGGIGRFTIGVRGDEIDASAKRRSH